MVEVDLFPGTFITYVWEGKLLVRRRACELRLSNAREKHSKFVEWRKKYTPQSIAWQQYDVLVRAERDKIARELDEINYVKGLSFAGPIVGGYMHVPGENNYRGPSIIDLFHRVADSYDESDEGNPFDNEKIAKGIRIGLDILTNGYKYLNEEERAGYDLASKVAEKASQEQLDRLEGHGTARTGPPKRGRPPGSKNKPKQSNAVDVTPTKINLFRINDSGVAEKI